MKKEPPKSPSHPYAILFVSVLHQNKALHNLRKRGQRSIAKRNIGQEYVLTGVLLLRTVASELALESDCFEFFFSTVAFKTILTR